MMRTWIRRTGSDWHWYSVKGCGAGWALNDWSGQAEMKETEGPPPPKGPACIICMSKAAREEATNER